VSGKNVNVFISDWTNDGVTVPVPRYSVNLRVEWIDEDGNPCVNEEVRRFPNELAGVPLKRMREYMHDIILSEVRIKLGIDSDPTG